MSGRGSKLLSCAPLMESNRRSSCGMWTEVAESEAARIHLTSSRLKTCEIRDWLFNACSQPLELMSIASCCVQSSIIHRSRRIPFKVLDRAYIALISRDHALSATSLVLSKYADL